MYKIIFLSLYILSLFLTPSYASFDFGSAPLGGNNIKDIFASNNSSQSSPYIVDFEPNSDGNIVANFILSPRNYLYRNKIKAYFENGEGKVDKLVLPEGVESHGSIVIKDNFRLTIKFSTKTGGNLVLSYQGCSEDGYCFPEEKKTIHVSAYNEDKKSLVSNLDVVPIDALDSKLTDSLPKENKSEESYFFNYNIKTLLEDGYWKIFIVFLLAGLLLALTPCLFPIYPILLGALSGVDKSNSPFKLSLFYVLGLVSVFTLLGILSSYLGNEVQYYIHSDIATVIMALIMAALSFSMFGFFHISMPSKITNYLNIKGSSMPKGSIVSATFLGTIGAITAGPCLAPPLAATLLYTANTGDILIGIIAFFSMGLGMGIPLIIFGTFLSQKLPKSGPWLSKINHIIGFVFLIIAVWIMRNIFPAPLIDIFYSLILIGMGITLWQINTIITQIFGVFSLFLSFLFLQTQFQLISSNSENKPITTLSSDTNYQSIPHTSNIKELNRFISSNKIAIVDFYADWCPSCEEVSKTLNSLDMNKLKKEKGFKILQVDLTKKRPTISNKYSVIGVPTVIIFKNGKEITRIVGPLSIEDIKNNI